MKCFLKMLCTAFAGGCAMNLAMLLTFRLIGFGVDGNGILLDPTIQSRKLIAVWTEFAPLPLVVNRPAPIILGLFGFAFAHAVIYRLLSPSWPRGVNARAWRLAALVFVLSFAFWEFFTPFNQFGEPMSLIVMELAFWAVVAAAESWVIAAAAERLWRESTVRTPSMVSETVPMGLRSPTAL